MEIAFVKMARVFHIERYFVMYPHKCTLKILKEKYQEKWENAYLIAKNTRASRALRLALDPSQYYIPRFAHPTSLHYVDKISEKISGAPLDQILDLLVEYPRNWVFALYQITVVYGSRHLVRVFPGAPGSIYVVSSIFVWLHLITLVTVD